MKRRKIKYLKPNNFLFKIQNKLEITYTYTYIIYLDKLLTQKRLGNWYYYSLLQN